MDSSSLIIVLALLGYLIGSIPFGVVVSRFLGAPDPRTAGSHNVGFTNVLRVSGKKAGILTLLGDIGKGWLVAWIGTLVLSQESSILFVALAPIIGHLHSCFLGFKGGKGVATALGSVLGVAPLLGLTLMGLWIGAVAAWRYSSGGALVAFALFPLVALLFHRSWLFVGFALLVSILIWTRHKDNLIRLWKGTERRIGERTPDQTATV
ncbi:MAG: glycerol-3-phosphate 1-O-acyltransferase PlsY [Nitrospiraceae bacterium]|nr:glycerol-3-phosphate 1-O-acyltransferase PlsY [Nitrospiraceae bacterium]